MAAEPRPGATVVVGWIRRAHGVDGAVEVAVESDVPSRFATGERLGLHLPDGSRREVEVQTVRPHRARLLVRFTGIETRSAAEGLRGGSLEVPVERVPAAPAGSYYYYELIGCRCRDRRLGDLGLVTDIREDGGGLLLIVEGPAGSLLIPFVKAYLATIDTADKNILCDLPAGLVETCASR